MHRLAISSSFGLGYLKIQTRGIARVDHRLPPLAAYSGFKFHHYASRREIYVVRALVFETLTSLHACITDTS